MTHKLNVVFFILTFFFYTVFLGKQASKWKKKERQKKRNWENCAESEREREFSLYYFVSSVEVSKVREFI